MGVVKNVGYDTFPKQGPYLGCRVKVCFHYETTRLLYGVLLRDDMEEPYRTVIRLDDGRIILSSECQYSPVYGDTQHHG